MQELIQYEKYLDKIKNRRISGVWYFCQKCHFPIINNKVTVKYENIKLYFHKSCFLDCIKTENKKIFWGLL